MLCGDVGLGACIPIPMTLQPSQQFSSGSSSMNLATIIPTRGLGALGCAECLLIPAVLGSKKKDIGVLIFASTDVLDPLGKAQNWLRTATGTSQLLVVAGQG